MNNTLKAGLFGLVTVAALGLGGCGGGLKEENAALRDENMKLTQDRDELKTKWNQSEANRSELDGKVQAKDADILRLQQELAAKTTYNPPVGGGNGGGTRGGNGNNGGTGGSTRTILAGDVLFGSGSASLTAGGRKEIDKVIADIKNNHGGDRIIVEGYTDSDPIKKSPYGTNKALSQARAEAVEKYMASKGISASRISAVGKGSESPRSSKAASRRVEIVIVDTN